MKKTNKKGFTIVELVIVIAVIAILAAVLVPNISRLVKKANQSADESLVRNLNTALAMDTEKHTTMTAALTAAYENGGYDVAKIVTKNSDAKILWDSVNDCFVYLNGSDKVYLPNTQTNKEVKDWNFFEIVDKVPALKDQKYSIYLTGNATIDAVTVSVGLDVGENIVKNITYSNSTSDSKSVTIYTKSFDTVITVNAEKDVVKHYGEAKEVNVARVATSSYHEFGTVSGNINLAYGKVELENGSSVSNIVVKEIIVGDAKVTPVSESVKVSVANGATVNLLISEVSGVSATVDGAGASSVAVLNDISGKKVAIGSKTYTSLTLAWPEIKSGDVVTLLDDCETTERLYVPENVKVTVFLNGHNITSSSRVFYVDKENGTLEVKGEGKISTTEQVVFGLIGSATDDGKYYVLKVGKDVEIESSVYGIAIFSNGESQASYGVDVTFEGHDCSKDGVVYINGIVQKKTGNVPVINLVNATCESTVYLAGFAKFYAVNSSFKLDGSLKIKAGEIHLSGNVFTVDCTNINKQEADYVKNGNGAFGSKCGILFENGVPNYSGLTSVSVSADNLFTFLNSNGIEYADVMYIDYTETASLDIKIDVRYIGIDQFKYRIAYSGKVNTGDCSGYIYFLDEERAKSYTMEKLKDQYGLTEVSTFGPVESVESK